MEVKTNKKIQIIDHEIVMTCGKRYSITHLKHITFDFDLVIDGTKYSIPIKIEFRDHCYSIEFKDGIHDEAMILPVRKFNDDRRVFCEERWGVSKRLPELIVDTIKKGILHKTDKSHVYFKIDKSDTLHKHRDDGIYVFLRISKYKNVSGLKISVESSHRRTNLPGNHRPGTVRFYSIALKMCSGELLSKPNK